MGRLDEVLRDEYLSMPVPNGSARIVETPYCVTYLFLGAETEAETQTPSGE